MSGIGQLYFLNHTTQSTDNKMMTPQNTQTWSRLTNDLQAGYRYN